MGLWHLVVERKDRRIVRQVRSPAGVRRFRLPIGAPILRRREDPGGLVARTFSAAEISAAVRAVAEHVARVDDRVTAAVTSIIRSHGGRPVGLEHRRKKPGRIRRSLTEILNRVLARGEAADLERAARGVPDALRYTAVLDDEDYASGALEIMADFARRGFRQLPGGKTNTWRSNEYRGANLRLLAPDGTRFELQFHTPASWEAKQKNHDLYEAYQQATDDTVRSRLRRAMAVRTQQVPVPPGADAVRWPGARASEAEVTLSVAVPRVVRPLRR
jgi:hypothetical protein